MSSRDMPALAPSGGVIMTRWPFSSVVASLTPSFQSAGMTISSVACSSSLSGNRAAGDDAATSSAGDMALAPGLEGVRRGR